MLIGWYIFIEYSTDIDIIDIIDLEVMRLIYLNLYNSQIFEPYQHFFISLSRKSIPCKIFVAFYDAL